MAGSDDNSSKYMGPVFEGSGEFGSAPSPPDSPHDSPDNIYQEINLQSASASNRH
jgi:hypothetical protein